MTYLFIHGAGCLPDVFAAQAQAFPDAIVPALPGHGVGGSASTLQEFADAIASDIEAMNARDVILAGHSMGGAIALTLALRRPAAVSGVVLLGGGARMRVAPSLLLQLQTDFTATARSIATSFYAEPTPGLIHASTIQMLQVGADQTIADFSACDGFDVRERLGDLDVPLLAITGAADGLMPPKLAQEAADRVRNGQARIIEGAGHMVMVERPDDTNELLRAFVKELTA